MNYENSVNKVKLTGVAASGIRFSHELYGEKFHEFDLAVARLSGAEDILPVTASERLLMRFPVRTGETLSIFGQFRSYNKLSDGKSKLILTVFAQEIFPEPHETLHNNFIELTGYVCKTPIYRTTPFNREICDVLLAVNRSYGKSDYIPAIAWGRNARFMKFLPVGKQIAVCGRVQSRIYQKRLENETVEKRTAYEVSIGKIQVGADFDAMNDAASAPRYTLSAT